MVQRARPSLCAGLASQAARVITGGETLELPPPHPDSEAASVPTTPTSAGRRRREKIEDIAWKLPSSILIYEWARNRRFGETQRCVTGRGRCRHEQHDGFDLKQGLRLDNHRGIGLKCLTSKCRAWGRPAASSSHYSVPQ